VSLTPTIPPTISHSPTDSPRISSSPAALLDSNTNLLVLRVGSGAAGTYAQVDMVGGLLPVCC
jgi:hypothetical protein